MGGLLLVTLPGEFTTAMGRRVANGVAAAADWPSARVVLVGLANEYLSYFATPEEYALQHYEGARSQHRRWPDVLRGQESTRRRLGS